MTGLSILTDAFSGSEALKNKAEHLCCICGGICLKVL